jgi:hypothetical protein
VPLGAPGICPVEYMVSEELRLRDHGTELNLKSSILFTDVFVRRLPEEGSVLA